MTIFLKKIDRNEAAWGEDGLDDICFTRAGALKVDIYLGATLRTKQDAIREWNMVDRLEHSWWT